MSQDVTISREEGWLPSVTINCGKGQDAYQVNLTVQDLETFYEAESRPDVAGKEGEAHVKALVATGIILALDRSKDGKYNDGPNGEPAIEVFSDNGILVCQARFQNDVQTDGVNGEAASLHFFDDGKLECITHYKNDEINNSASGEPATRAFNEKGQLVFLALGANGVDTVLKFNGNGKLLDADIKKDGKWTELTKKETADYAEQFKNELAGYIAAYSLKPKKEPPKPTICPIWPNDMNKKPKPPRPN